MPIVTTQFPASFALSALNGKNGFSLTGATAHDRSGVSVSSAGDINGDGISDFIIGAYNASPGGKSNAGISYVVFGRHDIGSSGTLALSSLNGVNGFSLTGDTVDGWSGISVSSAGDVNDDGISDLIIGARNVSPGGKAYAGVSYVVFGKHDIGSSGTLTLSSLNGVEGFNLTGVTANDRSGGSVSGVGDINGDGISDFIIGAENASPGGKTQAGTSYVVFGKRGIGSSGTLALSSLNGVNGFSLTGVTASDFSGSSVSSAGDINNDGISDLIIGAYGASNYAGTSYVVFGKHDIGNSGTLALDSLNGVNGFSLTGVRANDLSGLSVSSAGDINGDGINDLIIGSYGASSGGMSAAGISYVVFGKSGIGSSGTLALGSLNGVNGFSLTGISANDNSGRSVSSAGDINGDDIGDLIIGANWASPENKLRAGTSYVVFGKSGIGSSGTLALESLNGANGFSLTGVSADDNSGFSVSSAGDINGDGIGDLTIGAYNASPEGKTYAGISYVVFGDKPATLIMTTNRLSVSEAQTVILSSHYLNTTNPLDSSKDLALLFTVSAIQHGRFTTGSSITSLTRFVQQQVFSGQIQFVHDGSESAPAYNVSVSYGKLPAASPQAAVITFIHLGPRLGNNALIVNQGQTVVLTTTMLSAVDQDNPDDDSSLVFTIINIRNGYFSLINKPTAPITIFMQAQVQSNSIQFVHDGSVNAPGYDVMVSDGGVTTAAQAAVISFDAIPVFINNRLTINQGQTIILTSNDLSGVNPYNSQASLTFIVNQVQHGHFSLISAPSISITTFTQSQIQNGDLQFVHDGSSNPPSYSLTVSDGRLSSMVQASSISFDIPPVLAANTLVINQGQTVVLNLNNLSASSPYMSIFTFTMSDVQQGYFALVSAPSTPITSFTQTQIQSGIVQFVHDGSVKAPSYKISINDGRMTSQTQTSVVSFDAYPVIVKNNVNVNQGEIVILTSDDLSAVNPYNPDAVLTFTITNVQHGHFELVSSSGTAITSFTQVQIQSRDVQFVPDGTPNAPSYSVSVSDGRLSSVVQSGTISFDVPPVLTQNSLSVNQGQAIVLTSSYLSATSSTMSASSLVFTVSQVQRGHFEIVSNPGIAITSFTQPQVQSGQVQFIQDGTNKAPSYFVLVSDGRMSSIGGPRPALITFNDIPLLVTNQLKITQGETVILGTGDLSATDQETPAGELVFTASDLAHGHFEDITTPGIATTVFAQQRVMSGGMKFVTDGSADAPAYSMSVSDGVLSSPSSKAIVNFTPKHEETPTQSDPVRNAIIGGVVSGVVGLGFFAVKACLERKAAKSLKQALEGGQTEMERRLISFQKEVIRPVANKVFSYIKTTNLIGYRSEKDTRAYVAAIETLLGRLADLGVNLDLQTMQAAQQNRLFTEIAKQTRMQLVPNYGCCSCAYVASFFKPEITPQQIEDGADVIAAAVQAAMRSSSQASTTKPTQRQTAEPTEMQEIRVSNTLAG